MKLKEVFSNLYDFKEGWSRSPRDDNKLEKKMPQNFRRVFRLLKHLIRIFLVATFVVFIYMVITRDWSILKILFWLLLIPNFIFSVIKQQMRIYAKKRDNGF